MPGKRRSGRESSIHLAMNEVNQVPTMDGDHDDSISKMTECRDDDHCHDYHSHPCHVKLRQKIEESWMKGHSSLDFLLKRAENEAFSGYSLGKEYKMRDVEDADYEEEGTLLRIILEDVVNGHEIIIKMLDNLVLKKVRNENAKNKINCPKCFEDMQHGVIQINVKPLFNKMGKSCEKNCLGYEIIDEMSMIRDLFYIQTIEWEPRNGDGNKELKKLFNHPVIETLILKKWDCHKYIAYWNRAIFFLFAVLFTAYVVAPYDPEQKTKSHRWNGLFRYEQCKLTKETPLASLWPFRGNESNTGHPPSLDIPVLFNCSPENAILASALWCVLMFCQLLNLIWQLGHVISHYRTQCTAPKNSTDENPTDFKIYKFSKQKRLIFLRCVNIGVLLLTLLIMSAIEAMILLMILWFHILMRQIFRFINQVVWLYWNYGIWQSPSEPVTILQIILIVTFPVAFLWSEPYAAASLEGFLTKTSMSETTIADDNWVRHFFTPKGMQVRNGLVALAVWCAWLNLIFVMGMPGTSLIGDFITMFYNVVKSKLWYYIQVFILLAFAFGFAFWILFEGDRADHHKGRAEDDHEMSFNKFFGSILLSVSMTMGELNMADFYGNFKGNTTKIFAMLFMVLLIILCAMAMLNLLVATIISDYQVMKKQMDHQNLMFMTHNIIETDDFISILPIPKFFKAKLFRFFSILKNPDDDFLDFCPHQICNNRHNTYRDNCTLVPLPRIRARNFRAKTNQDIDGQTSLLDKFLGIKQEDNNNTVHCDDHKD